MFSIKFQSLISDNFDEISAILLKMKKKGNILCTLIWIEPKKKEIDIKCKIIIEYEILRMKPNLNWCDILH